LLPEATLASAPLAKSAGKTGPLLMIRPAERVKSNGVIPMVPSLEPPLG